MKIKAAADMTRTAVCSLHATPCLMFYDEPPARVAQWIEHSTLVPLTCGGVSSSRLERSLFARDRDGLRPVAAAAQRSDDVNGRAGRVQILGHVKLSPQNSAVELELRDRVVG